MSFINLGTSSQLTIKVPVPGTTGWADTMRTDTFLKIAEHDHTASGKGAQLGTGSLLADAVTGAKIRLDNDEYIKARNAADSANINLIKVDANDDAYIDPDLAKLNLKNDTYLTGRNNADGADVNMFKIGTDDEIKVGSTLTSATITSSTSTTIVGNGSVTLTDNVSTTSTGIIDLAANEAVEVKYKINRNGALVSGTLEIEESNLSITRVEVGDDVGVTFNLDASTADLEYSTTSTGQNATMTYIIIKK